MWTWVISVVCYHLREQRETLTSMFLLLFMLTQQFDVGVFLTEGRIVEPSCAFVDSKMMGHILLPSIALSQHIVQVVVPPPERYREKKSPRRRRSSLLEDSPSEVSITTPRDEELQGILSSYRFLSVATHMIVIVSALHSTECGRDGNEVIEAVAYGSIVVYVVSLPARVGGVFFVVLAALFALLFKLKGLVDAHTPHAMHDGSAYCFLYAAIFLCEHRFAKICERMFCSRGVGDAAMQLTQRGENEEQVVSSAPSSPIPLYVAPCRYEIFTKSEQLIQQQLILQQRQQQQEQQRRESLQQEREKELRSPQSSNSPPRQNLCKFPVTTRRKIF